MRMLPHWFIAAFILGTLPLGSDYLADRFAHADTPSDSGVQAFNDFDIVAAVSNKLFKDRYFRPKSIQIQSINGDVTLTGIVGNLRGKERAIQTAEAVKGVKSVIDRLTVSSSPKPDKLLQDDVKTALILDSTTTDYPVQVTVKNGIVTLTGNLDSFSQKHLAQWVAKGVAGVKQLQDDMIVLPITHRPDSEIAKDIQGRLRMDPWVNSANIQVNVVDGKVSLLGVVASAAAKSRAYADAWASGVKSVSNQDMKVDYVSYKPPLKTTPAGKSDTDIKTEITNAFMLDPRVEVFPPQIAVNQGTVTLTGNVGSVIAKKAAVEDASNTAGVLSVKDQLQVKPRVAKSDSKITQDIKTTLGLNAPDLKNDIQVNVNQGKVRLSGNVATPYQKWIAWDSASRVNGVTHIDNQVQVTSNTPQIPDADLQASVVKGLHADPFIDPADRIQVSTKRGAVTLSGQVDSWADRLSATEDAFSNGATEVTNQIQVLGFPNQSISYFESAFPVAMPGGLFAWPMG